MKDLFHACQVDWISKIFKRSFHDSYIGMSTCYCIAIKDIKISSKREETWSWELGTNKTNKFQYEWQYLGYHFWL